jgi:hypothetical protein
MWGLDAAFSALVGQVFVKVVLMLWRNASLTDVEHPARDLG